MAFKIDHYGFLAVKQSSAHHKNFCLLSQHLFKSMCAAEQQKSCSSICSQWAKHVVQHSSRQETTEQIIMIQIIVTSWTGATLRPSVPCPCSAGVYVCLSVCSLCVSDVILDISHTFFFFFTYALITSFTSLLFFDFQSCHYPCHPSEHAHALKSPSLFQM